jgi:hypothetical protein
MPTNLSIHINNRVANGIGLGAVDFGPHGNNCSLDNGSLLAITRNQCNQWFVLFAKISFV